LHIATFSVMGDKAPALELVVVGALLFDPGNEY